jgi:hypothetical protein
LLLNEDNFVIVENALDGKVIHRRDGRGRGREKGGRGEEGERGRLGRIGISSIAVEWDKHQKQNRG